VTDQDPDDLFEPSPRELVRRIDEAKRRRWETVEGTAVDPDGDPHGDDRIMQNRDWR
jgi:hypothetical protein